MQIRWLSWVVALAAVGCGPKRYQAMRDVASGQRLVVTATPEGADVVARVQGVVPVYRRAWCWRGTWYHGEKVRNEHLLGEMRRYRCGAPTPRPNLGLNPQPLYAFRSGERVPACLWGDAYNDSGTLRACPGATPAPAPAGLRVTATLHAANGGATLTSWYTTAPDGSVRFRGMLPTAVRLASFCGGAEIRVVAEPPAVPGYVVVPGEEPLDKHPDLPWRPFTGLRPSEPAVLTLRPDGNRSLDGLGSEERKYLLLCDPELKRNACLDAESKRWNAWHAAASPQCRDCGRVCSANTSVCISHCPAGAPELEYRACRQRCLMAQYWKCFADCGCPAPPGYGTACR